MTDRELLGLAAKAFGIAIGFEGNLVYCENCVEISWNPLTDDGDALRLAVKLNLIVECMVCQSAARTFDGLKGGCVDHANSEQYVGRSFLVDPYAATRLAIVRAAAAIGKTMP